MFSGTVTVAVEGIRSCRDETGDNSQVAISGMALGQWLVYISEW